MTVFVWDEKIVIRHLEKRNRTPLVFTFLIQAYIIGEPDLECTAAELK